MVLKRLLILQMVLLIGLPILLTSCQINGQKEQRITDIHIYQHTPAWELALAVRDRKVNKIEKIINEDPDLLNVQDPQYGATVLLWAVGMDKYKSAETLLRLGADPIYQLRDAMERFRYSLHQAFLGWIVKVKRMQDMSGFYWITEQIQIFIMWVVIL